MRAVVDKAACCGYALCVEICPEVYKLNADAVVEILLDQIPEDLTEKVLQAVAECPQSALATED
jgi:ferredoxin